MKSDGAGGYTFSDDEEAAARQQATNDGTLKTPSKADDAAQVAQMRAGQNAFKKADATRAAPSPGSAGRKTGGKGGSSSSLRSKVASPVMSKFSSDDLAGAVMGALGYIIVINYLRGGLPQVRGWFAAKFLNRPYKAAATPGGEKSATSTTPTTPPNTNVKNAA